MSDLRTGKRFPLSLPITIRSKKQARNNAATTADVSAAGVYIQADADLEVGTKIEFDISLPANVVGTDSDVEIVCKGRVIRMDNASGKNKAKKAGVACVIDHYKFVRKK
ncbi:MAG TPA: PilZ domain-containing protein [Terriglobales bacterium]|nr:PilZ domain-containing protein [Terriglobales bacterium]